MSRSTLSVQAAPDFRQEVKDLAGMYKVESAAEHAVGKVSTPISYYLALRGPQARGVFSVLRNGVVCRVRVDATEGCTELQ